MPEVGVWIGEWADGSDRAVGTLGIVDAGFNRGSVAHSGLTRAVGTSGVDFPDHPFMPDEPTARISPSDTCNRDKSLPYAAQQVLTNHT